MKTAAVVLSLLWWAASLSALQAGNLLAEFRGGKTFITYREDTASSGESYRIYRSQQPITAVDNLTPLVVVKENSSWDSYFGRRHVIKDLSAPLDAKTGLFVYTPKVNGAAYYAVTSVLSNVENKTVTAGGNALAAPVAEEYWKAPLGVLTQKKDSTYYYFYYWMDYSTWANGQEYYGNFFNVGVDFSVVRKTQVPLYVYLHALNSGPGMPIEGTYSGTYALRTNDPNNTWWYGTGSSNYTEQRLSAYMDAVIHDPRFSVDTNRIYLRGQSMGGKGTLTNGFHFPGRFACLVPFLAPIDTSMTNIVKRNPAAYFPPVTDYFGSQDSPEFGMAGHRLMYTTFAEARQGVWGQWGNHGHQPAGDPNTLVRGSFLRFRKDEMFPAFTHSTKDWNYGLANPSVYDAIGVINAYIDWSSSLHKLGLKNDSLVDASDSLSITVTSPLAGTVVDLTPRNLQRFSISKGNAYAWRSVDVATDTVAVSGTVTPDVNGLLTLKAVSLCKTGNRFVIFAPGVNGAELSGPSPSAGLQISASPNPFHGKVSLSFPRAVSRVTIYGISGKVAASFRPMGRSAVWDASRFPAGAFIVSAESKGRRFTKRIALIH